jgi:phosphatidylglycerophosphatase B
MDRNFSRPAILALSVMMASWMALWLSHFLPEMDLSGDLSVIVTYWTHSGDVLGITLFGLGLMGLLVLRPSVPWKRRLNEMLVHVLVLVVLQGGGALVNEHLIKNAAATPRPNIVWLEWKDDLGMTAEQFYASLDREQRRSHLEQILTNPGFDGVELSVHVRAHWIHEVGYSLPSGHAYSAMFFASYFLAMGLMLAVDWRRWVILLLPGWAVSVAWSRVLLRVHRPIDVVWGGLLGVVLGAMAVCLATQLLSIDKGSGRQHSRKQLVKP